MDEARHSIITMGLGNYNRPEESLLITMGFPVKSDQRMVIRGDSGITRKIEGESPVLKQIAGESPVLKQIDGESCLTKEVRADSLAVKKIEGDSRIPLENRYPT
jgi:hypothetical protein